MTSFLDICYRDDAGVMGSLEENTFGMVPTWHYGILRGYINAIYYCV